MEYVDVSEFGFDGPKINVAMNHFQDDAHLSGQQAVDTKAFTGKGMGSNWPAVITDRRNGFTDRALMHISLGLMFKCWII